MLKKQRQWSHSKHSRYLWSVRKPQRAARYNYGASLSWGYDHSWDSSFHFHFVVLCPVLCFHCVHGELLQCPGWKTDFFFFFRSDAVEAEIHNLFFIWFYINVKDCDWALSWASRASFFHLVFKGKKDIFSPPSPIIVSTAIATQLDRSLFPQTHKNTIIYLFI